MIELMLSYEESLNRFLQKYKLALEYLAVTFFLIKYINLYNNN